uniref:protein-serine/threonine phosphatase n=2 Tax=Triticum urartu TaxID=4572 RepID=A0A8R7PPH9_TRIUA
NCGISRAVISRGGEILQLTSEHRPNRPDEKQRVENGGGRVDESTNTVDEFLPTSRAFGSYLYKQYVIAEPEVTAVGRDPRDEFLILATAG